MLKALQLYRNYAKHIKTGVDWLEPFEHYTPGQVYLCYSPLAGHSRHDQHVKACEASPLFCACKSALHVSRLQTLLARWLSVARGRVCELGWAYYGSARLGSARHRRPRGFGARFFGPAS